MQKFKTFFPIQSVVFVPQFVRETIAYQLNPVLPPDLTNDPLPFLLRRLIMYFY